jgi:hypothetical protein
LFLTAINKTEQVVAITTPFRDAGRQCLLTGPALNAKHDTTLAWSKASALHHGVLHVEPHSAALIKE